MDFANEHIGRIDAQTLEIKLYETPTFDSRPRRGEVDSQYRVGSARFGVGMVGMFDSRTEEFQEWVPPTPHIKPYDTHLGRYGDFRTRSMYTDRNLSTPVRHPGS